MKRRHEIRSAGQQHRRFVVGIVAPVTAFLAIVSIVQVLCANSSAALAEAEQSAAAQAPAARTPQPPIEFDVVSIKPAQEDPPGRMQVGIVPQPGGRFVAHNVTLAMLLQMAYELKGPKQIEGAPDWAGSHRFDIEARAAGVSGKLSRQQLSPYVQALLGDRFRLVAHREIHQQPVYALVLAKPGKLGPQLKPHIDDSDCADPSAPAPGPGIPGPPTPGGPPAKLTSFCGGFSAMMAPDGIRLSGNKITMELLASQLSGGPFGDAIGRIVIDRTGLSGTYDLSLSFSPSGLPPGPKGLDLAGPQTVNAGASPISAETDSQVLPTALQEQLALKLEPQTGPVDVLVVDHVEQPSPN